MLLLKINTQVVYRSVGWLGNTKETTDFDDILDIKILYRIDQHF